jgi:predicted aldo/keto reductase-like oxidoreductase
MTRTHAISRRNFCSRSTLALGGVALAATPTVARACEPTTALPRRPLGSTGASIGTLTLGTAPCGRSPSDVRSVARTVDTALELGVDAIDTSPCYGNAEEAIGLALGGRRREVFLSTKIEVDTVADAARSLAASLRALRTDHIDLLYFQNAGTRDAGECMAPGGVFDWMLKQKRLGAVRFVGVSGHNLSARLAPYIASEQVDVALIVLNFVDRYLYGFERGILPLARRHGVGVVAMKVFGGVRGGVRHYDQQSMPAQLDDQHLPLALRYALDLPGVASAAIGVYDEGDVRNSVEMAKQFAPLSADEQVALRQLGRRLAAGWTPHFGPSAAAATPS